MSQTITLRKTPCHVAGQLPVPGAPLPDFTLTTSELADVHLDAFAGQYKIFNIFPSLDTPTCAASVKRFNDSVQALANTVLLQVSADLPFAHARFCSAEGLANGLSLSMLRDKSFAHDFGVAIEDGPLAGLCARAVIVANPQNTVIHSELVPEIAQQPDYDRAIAAVKD